MPSQFEKISPVRRGLRRAEIKIDEGELWYSATSRHGLLCPLTAESDLSLRFYKNDSCNQMQPLLLSDRGRLLYCPSGMKADFHAGKIIAEACENAPSPNALRFPGLHFRSAREPNLRAAVDLFLEEFLRPYLPAETAAPDFLLKNVYNTWIELQYNQTQNGVLNYARALLAAGFPPGTLMIDDGWSEDYGDWRFHQGRFPDPVSMIRTLRHLGFRVMLWICPYVSPDSARFRELEAENLLLLQGDRPYLLRWWNGYSAAPDLRSEVYLKKLREELKLLLDAGVEGFKFDGGDSVFYLDAHEPDRQSYEWARFACEYRFNELRADFDTAMLPLLERLCDKRHSWGSDGLASLIPDSLALSLGGHPLVSPDMIAGGEYRCFLNPDPDSLDRNLILRNASLALFMPVVQFSLLLPRVLGTNSAEMNEIRRLMKLREILTPLYEELLEPARRGLPVMHYPSYVCPEQPWFSYPASRQCFFIGNDLWISASVEKEIDSHTALLPPGTWFAAEALLSSAHESPAVCESPRIAEVRNAPPVSIWLRDSAYFRLKQK